MLADSDTSEPDSPLLQLEYDSDDLEQQQQADDDAVPPYEPDIQASVDERTPEDAALRAAIAEEHANTRALAAVAASAMDEQGDHPDDVYEEEDARIRQHAIERSPHLDMIDLTLDEEKKEEEEEKQRPATSLAAPVLAPAAASSPPAAASSLLVAAETAAYASPTPDTVSAYMMLAMNHMAQSAAAAVQEAIARANARATAIARANARATAKPRRHTAAAAAAAPAAAAAAAPHKPFTRWTAAMLARLKTMADREPVSVRRSVAAELGVTLDQLTAKIRWLKKHPQSEEEEEDAPMPAPLERDAMQQ